MALLLYIKIFDNIRYVDCKIFADKFSSNGHFKKHPKEFILTVARQIHPAVQETEFTRTEGSGHNQKRYILFSWFVLIMLAAPSNKIPRTEREAWIQHWFEGTVPNPSSSDYSWNREPAAVAPIIDPPMTPIRAMLPPPAIRELPGQQQSSESRRETPRDRPIMPCPSQETPLRPTETPPARRDLFQTPAVAQTPENTPAATPRSDGYNTKDKRFLQFIDDLGESFIWRKLLVRLAASDGEAYSKFLTDAVKSLDDSSTSRRKKVLPLLIRLLVGTRYESAKVPIALDWMHGTAKQMLCTVKDLYGYLVQLPTINALSNIRDNLRIQFINTWSLENIPGGMRVSLVKAVTHVAKEVYGLDSLEDVRVDIWGDGMLRGTQEIVRLCFRVLGCPDPNIQFKCQSRLQTFTFAVFCGKDSFINMEKNLMSFNVVGEKGWLYLETEYLVNILKVHLTISGDAPWTNRLILGPGVSCDTKFLSNAGIYYPDPTEEDLETLCARNQISRTDIINKKQSHAVQTELCRIGCILPQNGLNGYRTRIDRDIDIPLPGASMIYLKSVGHICFDGFHATVRITEKDVKLIAEYLLEKGRIDNFKRLEKNMNDRGIKSHFSFTFSKGTTLETAKKIGDVKFSGEDARVLLADFSELEGSGAGPLFEGVLYHDRLVPHNNDLVVKILSELHEITLLESEGVSGIYQIIYHLSVITNFLATVE